MSIQIRKGAPGELDSFVALLNEVRTGMENKEWFYVDTPEEFRAMMDSDAMHIWFAVDEEKIVGAQSVLIPGTESYNYGWWMGYPEETLRRVVNIDSTAVDPAYRGRGIQRLLLRTAESWLEENSPDGILLCTIHPDNRYSLQNALKLGYEIRKTVAIYGSVRYLLKKELKKTENKY